METDCAVVLDVGKTNAKLTLWTPAGKALARRSSPNRPVEAPGYRALDADGLERWIAETLKGFAAIAGISAIVPVTHGAAAALISKGALFAPPMDYEQAISAQARAQYDLGRDPFAEAGSPALPLGLNLGVQLHLLEGLTGPWPDDLQIVPWPQYWAWRLSGIAASEVSSLGCHTDLWRPRDGRPSDMARRRGWAERFAPLRWAGEILGPITAEWAERTGLPAQCQVLCGLHDSNAALLAARGHAEVARHDATVFSTGTWFVAMRSPDPSAPVRSLPVLDEARDCLLNIDVAGRLVPSARFMGGREAEALGRIHVTDHYDPEALIGELPSLLAAGVMALPSFAPGMGPFPHAKGRWFREPASRPQARAAAELYLALMADVCLDLIGSCDRLLVEGRFAEADLFVRALATLRPGQRVYVSNAQDDVPYGALRLIHPQLEPASALRLVAPIDAPLDAYRARWRDSA